MARKPMMAGNWKMNNAIGEAVVLTQEISNNWWKDWEDKVDVVICPPFVDLKPVKTVLEFDKTKIFVGAQNVYWEEAGAFTGEVSVPMIRECGCDYCIVGHSERRGLFGETNEDVNKKLRALLGGRLKPIVCVGESLAVRDEARRMVCCCAQVKVAFAGVDAEDAAKCVVAYEPIWAIGTGRTATPEQAEEVCAAIRAQLAVLFGEETAQAMRILYGGSMNPRSNVPTLVASRHRQQAYRRRRPQVRLLHPAREGGHVVMGVLDSSARKGHPRFHIASLSWTASGLHPPGQQRHLACAHAVSRYGFFRRAVRAFKRRRRGVWSARGPDGKLRG